MGRTLVLRAAGLCLGVCLLTVSPATTAAQEGASELARPGDADAERPFELSAPGSTLRVIGAPDYERRTRDSRRLRRRSVLLASLLGTTLTVGLAAVMGHRSANQCHGEMLGECERDRRAAAFTTWAIATPLIMPLAAWLGGHAAGGRGRYLPTLLTTTAFMLVSGLIGAMTMSLAETDAGRGVGLGVSAMVPFFAATIGYGASDAEQRHFR